jgi:predicted ATP-grasp superfamily ATP-dependent carboligase
MCNFKILLSDATSYKAVVVGKFIKKMYPHIRLYTCDHRRASGFFHSKYSDVHILLDYNVENTEEYMKSLSKIITDHEVDLFFPVNSVEMNTVLSQRDRFGKSLSYWGDYSSFQVLNDKNRLMQLCRECCIKMPRCFDSFEQVDFPLVIKPNVSSSAKGVKYFSNTDDLERYKDKVNLKDFLMQQYIKGIGVGYSIFAVNGEIKVGYGHKRLAEYPVNGGSSMYRENYEDRRMAEIADKIIRKTGWSGFAMFEFKLTKEGELYLIEVNPRIWGSINQGLQNGVNYFSVLLGTKNITAKRKTNTYFSPFVYLSFLLYLLRGNAKPLLNFLLSLPHNKADVSLFEDPRGWLGSFVRMI